MRQQLPEQVSSDKVDIWFQDEGRFGQRNSLSRVWAEKGSRPGLIRQQQYEYVYLFGAVCPAKDKAIALLLPKVNAWAMSLHLKEISAATPTERQAVVVMDQAGWHIASALPAFDNLTIIPLPPYSPELNSAEGLWEWLRQHELSNRCFECYDDIVEACTDAGNKRSSVPGLLKSLCSRDWAVIQ